MPSLAFARWDSVAQKALDEIEKAHGAVEGKKGRGQRRGRRYATLQINHAYAVLVSSQFQGFCRDLHSEAVDFIASKTTPPDVAVALRLVMSQGRKLDGGNPNPGNIGSDFARLGMQFWKDVRKADKRNGARHKALEQLNVWRNAIAHQDWSEVGPGLQLRTVRRWRSMCRVLARSFDSVANKHLTAITGDAPW